MWLEEAGLSDDKQRGQSYIYDIHMDPLRAVSPE